MPKKHNIYIFTIWAVLNAILITACSTAKNTAQTRWWHAFNTKYNIYYNAQQTFINAQIEKENANNDNLLETLPLNIVANKTSREIGRDNYERTIEKCKKAISLHSISKKPTFNNNIKKTEKQKSWLKRKEYNPFLWKAWTLMAEAQFQEGKFQEAANTFEYICRIYETQPEIYQKAMACKTMALLELGWIYDAEQIIKNIKREKINWKAEKDWDKTFTNFYIKTNDIKKAIYFLTKVIKQENRKILKTREYYLLAQLYTAINNKQGATKAYKKVIALNPNYNMELNARVALTEVMVGKDTKNTVQQLKKMLKNPKNKNVKDRILYVIGNIFLTKKDTIKAIRAYERGNELSTKNGIEKGALLRKLGDIYWTKQNFDKAQKSYQNALGLTERENKDYNTINKRSEMLDQLVPYTNQIVLQDSLQHLAKLNEKQRNMIIDKIIAELIKREKQQQKENQEKNAEKQINKNSQQADFNNNQTLITRPIGADKGTWYFYNLQAVEQGIIIFQKKWGKRENIDNWQRVNKSVVKLDNLNAHNNENNITDTEEEKKQQNDSIQNKSVLDINNPHKREYYMAQIPLTPQQLKESNNKLQEALYNAAVILKDKIELTTLAQKYFNRIINQFPTYGNMPEVYYHMYLINAKKGNKNIAKNFLEKLSNNYPKHKLTLLLNNPNYETYAKFGKQIEDSLYASAYEDFKADRFEQLSQKENISKTHFPKGENRDKFIFINAMGKLANGKTNDCINDLKLVVEKYPQSKIAELAGNIINGVQKGRIPYNKKINIDNNWSYNKDINEKDTTIIKKLNKDTDTDFLFILQYNTKDVDEKQLLYNIAKYNFTCYLVRNFDIIIEKDKDFNYMLINGFRNYDEALQYAENIYNENKIKPYFNKAKTYVISQENKKLIGKQYSYQQYEKFYLKHMATIKISSQKLLNKPTEIITKKYNSINKDKKENQTNDNDEYYDIQ